MLPDKLSSARPGTAGPHAPLPVLPAGSTGELQRLLQALSGEVWRLLRPTAVDVVLLAAAIDRTFCTALLISPRTALLAFRSDPDAVLGGRSKLARLGPVVHRLSDEEIDALAAIKATSLEEFAAQALALTGELGPVESERRAAAGLPVPWQPLPGLPASTPAGDHVTTPEASAPVQRRRTRVMRLRFIRGSAVGAAKQPDLRRTASSRAGWQNTLHSAAPHLPPARGASQY
jgi:hypothetical protein